MDAEGGFEGPAPEAVEVAPVLKRVPFFSDAWLHSEHLQLYPLNRDVGNFEDQRERARQHVNGDYVPRYNNLGLGSSDEDESDMDGPSAMEVDEEMTKGALLKDSDYCFMCATCGDGTLGNHRKNFSDLFAYSSTVSIQEVVARIHFLFMSNVFPQVRKIWTPKSIRDHMLKHELDPSRIQAHVVRRLLELDANYAATAMVIDDEGNFVMPDHMHTRLYCTVLTQLQRANTEYLRIANMS